MLNCFKSTLHNPVGM